MARTAEVSGFGRRNLPKATQPGRAKSAPRKRRNGTASAAMPKRTAVVREQRWSSWIFDAPDIEYPEWTITEKAWAYIKSIVLGIAAVMALSSFAGFGENNPMMGFSWYNLYIAIFMTPAIAVGAWVPVRICTQVLRALRVRRGLADILVGVLIAGALPMVLISGGEAFKAFHLVFPLVGALCGFFFWRTQGYPGLESQTTKSFLDLVAKQAR